MKTYVEIINCLEEISQSTHVNHRYTASLLQSNVNVNNQITDWNQSTEFNAETKKEQPCVSLPRLIMTNKYLHRNTRSNIEQIIKSQQQLRYGQIRKIQSKLEKSETKALKATIRKKQKSFSKSSKQEISPSKMIIKFPVFKKHKKNRVEIQAEEYPIINQLIQNRKNEGKTLKEQNDQTQGHHFKKFKQQLKQIEKKSPQTRYPKERINYRNAFLKQAYLNKSRKQLENTILVSISYNK